MNLFLLLSALFAQATEIPIHCLEANCRSQAEENGSFLCQNLMLIGKVNERHAYLELAADNDEDKTSTQAHLADSELGFCYSTRDLLCQ